MDINILVILISVDRDRLFLQRTAGCRRAFPNIISEYIVLINSVDIALTSQIEALLFSFIPQVTNNKISISKRQN